MSHLPPSNRTCGHEWTLTTLDMQTFIVSKRPSVATSICRRMHQLNERKSTQIYLIANDFNRIGMPIILVSLHVVVVAIEYSNIKMTGLSERHNGRI